MLLLHTPLQFVQFDQKPVLLRLAKLCPVSSVPGCNNPSSASSDPRLILPKPQCCGQYACAQDTDWCANF